MTVTTNDDHLQYEKLEYDDRYFLQTAKNSIESLVHVVAEAGSNEDEAIARAALRDGTPDRGSLRWAYDPETMILSLTGNGDGMTADKMRERLRRVGAESNKDAKRGFFHRGIREVFLAMGGGVITSIGQRADGTQVLSQARFDPRQGIALTTVDAIPTAEQRSALGLTGTGTRVEIPMGRFVRQRPTQFEFSKMEQQLRDCVGLRPVLADPDREVTFIYGAEPPRPIRFEYPEGEDLVVERSVTVGEQTATFWARLADKPVKGRSGKQTRTNGILVRGERAAYEVTLGDEIARHPAIVRVFGELRIDGIEQLQREADAEADDEAQLVYKPDRSGLNREHPLVQAILAFIDKTLAPLIADKDANEQKKNVSTDTRRQLAKLARAINQVIEANITVDEDPEGDPKPDPEPPTDDDDNPPPPPPLPPVDIIREVDDGVQFTKSRMFVTTGESKTLEVWFDTAVIPAGEPVTVTRQKSAAVSAAVLSVDAVPVAAKDGIAAGRLTVHAGNAEGRVEITVSAGGYQDTLAVHVSFPRASGFISSITPVDQDIEAGSAMYDPSSGEVKVYVGRPEFVEAQARAKRDGDQDPWKNRSYRLLVVESVREAALWEAARRKALVELDEMSADERNDPEAFYEEARFAYQELDYLLRAKLISVFGEV